MKMKWLIQCLVFTGFILFIGCNINATYNNRVEDKDDALKVAVAFYSLEQKNHFYKKPF